MAIARARSVCEGAWAGLAFFEVFGFALSSISTGSIWGVISLMVAPAILFFWGFVCCLGGLARLADIASTVFYPMLHLVRP